MSCGQVGGLLLGADIEPPLDQRWLALVAPPPVGIVDLIPQAAWAVLVDRSGRRCVACPGLASGGSVCCAVRAPGADCLAQPPVGMDVLHSRTDFFFLGIKSYGRLNTFFLLTGYKQVDQDLGAIQPSGSWLGWDYPDRDDEVGGWSRLHVSPILCL